MNDSTTSPKQPTDQDESRDVAQYVHSLLQQMQERFQTMSDQILGRIDEMGNRIEDLEKNVDGLMASTGVPNQPEDKFQDETGEKTVAK